MCTDQRVGALLHGYELGVLPADDLEKFEKHLLACSACCAELERFGTESTLLRHSERVQDDVCAMVRPAARRAPWWQHLWAYLWPDAPWILRPGLLVVCIALLMFPAYRGLQERDSREVRPVQSIWLVPNRSTSDATFSSSADRDGLITFQYPQAEPNRTVIIAVRTPDGAALLIDSAFAEFDAFQTGSLLFPRELMRPGVYRLFIYDPDGDSSKPEMTYEFRVD